MKIDGSSRSTWPRPTSSVSASRTPTIESVSVSSSTAEVVASTLDPTDKPCVRDHGHAIAHAVLAPSVDRDDVVVEVSDPPRTTVAVYGEVGANVDAGRGIQPVELCSLGLDRQLVAFELLDSLGEQTVLRFEIVIVKDGVPRIGERRTIAPATSVIGCRVRTSRCAVRAGRSC